MKFCSRIPETILESRLTRMADIEADGADHLGMTPLSSPGKNILNSRQTKLLKTLKRESGRRMRLLSGTWGPKDQ